MSLAYQCLVFNVSKTGMMAASDVGDKTGDISLISAVVLEYRQYDDISISQFSR